MPAEPPPPAERPFETARREANESIDDLFRRAFDLKDKKRMSALFNYLGSVKRYSIFNLVMAKLQRPGCGAIATVERWSELGRTVVSEAIPILILRPGGPIMPVYDVGDTIGPKLPDDWLEVKGYATDADYERLRRNASKKDHIEVREIALGYLHAGDARLAEPTRVNHQSGESVDFVIRIASHQSNTQKFLTIAHELSHIYCGHLGATRESAWPDRSHIFGKAEREFEAEGSAYLVARRAGLETKSLEYLAGYAAGCDRHQVSYAQIIRAAGRIENHWRPTKSKLGRWP